MNDAVLTLVQIVIDLNDQLRAARAAAQAAQTELEAARVEIARLQAATPKET